MKKIEALIRTSRFDVIHQCIAELGVKFMTFYEVKGMGLQQPKPQQYRGVVYEPTYIPRTKLEIVVTDEMAEPVIECILKEGRTGEVGDGKIFVSDILAVYRIRNADMGEDAL
ncbi:MAG TPA: P-II family nitrogen regulator [Cyclobacteriaceae bacterium]|nr:P-II family nitrogen regulator [Cyclobacteriaceae bacterium]